MNAPSTSTHSPAGQETLITPSGEAFHAPVELQRTLQQQMMRAVARVRTQQDLLAQLCQAVSPLLRPAAMFYYSRNQAGELASERLSVSAGAIHVGDDLAAQIRRWSEADCQQGTTGVHAIDGLPGVVVIVAPVVLRGRPPEAVAAVVVASKNRGESPVSLLQLFSAHVTLWRVLNESVNSESEAESTAAIVELLARAQSQQDLQQAALSISSELQDFLGCRRIIIGLGSRPGGRVRIEAVSGMPGFDRRSEWSRAAEAALEEARVRDALTVWPPIAETERHAALAHERLSALCDNACLVSLPLRNEQQESLGAWLFVGESKQLQTPKTLAFIRAAETPVACCLDLVRRASPGPVARCARALLGRDQGWRWKGACIAMLLMIAVGCLPMTYHVRCDCETQPVVRRFVAAPFAASLEKALVRPGDVVAKGQLLAKLDGRELRWELAALEAEYQGEAKKRDVAMAEGEAAEAQLARLGMQRVELRRRLLEHRSENLEIRSPLPGMVISGELDRSEGAPLAVGEVMFEIAPLDAMVLEVGVPESEIAYVEQGMQVEIILDAYPRHSWRGKVQKIHPRAEASQYQTVFIAEVVLENHRGDLRPGMHGAAWVASRRFPLAWNLLHKAWDSLPSILGW
ncbi:MAG: efflux RND transporter periplasmic adaptor subunit [Pirellulaceae bacterium]